MKKALNQDFLYFSIKSNNLFELVCTKQESNELFSINRGVKTFCYCSQIAVCIFGIIAERQNHFKYVQHSTYLQWRENCILSILTYICHVHSQHYLSLWFSTSVIKHKAHKFGACSMDINQTPFILSSYFTKIRNPFDEDRWSRKGEKDKRRKDHESQKKKQEKKYIYHVRSNWIFLNEQEK